MTPYRTINAKAVARLQLRVDKAAARLDRAQPGTDAYDKADASYQNLASKLRIMKAKRKEYLDQLERDAAARRRT